jgi:hypothetical protein
MVMLVVSAVRRVGFWLGNIYMAKNSRCMVSNDLHSHSLRRSNKYNTYIYTSNNHTSHTGRKGGRKEGRTEGCQGFQHCHLLSSVRIFQ